MPDSRKMRGKDKVRKPIRTILRKTMPALAGIMIACSPAKRTDYPETTDYPAVQRKTKEAKRVSELIKLLDSKDPDMRFEAADAIWRKAEMDPQLLVKHIPEIFAALKNSDREVRRKMAWSLVRIGKPAVPFAIKGLEAKGLERALAVYLLVRIGKPALPGLFGLVKKNFSLGNLVSDIIGKMGKPVVPELIQRLKNRDPDTRCIAAYALVDIYSRNPVDSRLIRATDTLVALIKAKYADHYTHPRASFAAARLLVKIGKPAMLPVLAVLKDRTSYTTSIAASVLGKIGDRSILPALRKLADSDFEKEKRDEARQVIKRISGK